MKPKPRDPGKAELLDLFEHFAQKHGLPIDDPATAMKVAQVIAGEFTTHRSNPIVLHGQRVQKMFAFVAASLHGCAAIKEEDAGLLFVPNAQLQRPDYRLTLKHGDEWLVEVKNHHKPMVAKRDGKLVLVAEYSFTRDYLESLVGYAQLARRPLKIAIYWSHLTQWTLTPVEKLSLRGQHYVITWLAAYKSNEMGALGDRDIGTVPPLIFRLTVDATKPRSLDDQGNATFIVENAILLCGDQQITDDLEKKLAFYFMLYGKWQSTEPMAVIHNGQFTSVDLIVQPSEPVEHQPFQMIGHLSTMIATRYDDLTVRDGVITRLLPDVDPASLGVMIPQDYKGKVLKLWIMHQIPSKS